MTFIIIINNNVIFILCNSVEKNVDNVDNYVPNIIIPIELTFPAPIVINISLGIQ